TDESGSTAEMAKWLGLPVVLVIDASAQARSAAALVHGFETFDGNLNVAAVIANSVAGEGHFAFVRDAIRQSCRAAPIGYLIREDGITLPSRHLGLVTACEIVNEDFLNRLADWIAAGIDLDELLKLSKLKAAPKKAPCNNSKRDLKEKLRVG